MANCKSGQPKKISKKFRQLSNKSIHRSLARAGRSEAAGRLTGGLDTI
jgi:hypothetical protein